MFQKLIGWISKALSESDGTPSSLRPPFWLHDFLIGFCFVAIVAATIAAFFLGKEFNPVPIGGVVAGWFGVNRGTKLVQKGMEPDPTAPPQ